MASSPSAGELLTARPVDEPDFLNSAQLRQLTNHKGKVYGVAWVDSDTLASISQSGQLVLTSVTGEEEARVQLKDSWVMAVGASPNGESIATGGLSNKLTLFARTDPKRSGTAMENDHTGYISSIAWENDNVIWSSSGDKTIKKWDVQTKKCVATLKGHTADVLSISLDRKRNLLASGSADEKVKIWDTISGECLKTLNLDDGDVNSVSFSSNRSLAACTEEGKLFVFNCDFAKITKINVGKRESCHAVALSPIGNTAYVCNGSSLTVCDLTKHNGNDSAGAGNGSNGSNPSGEIANPSAEPDFSIDGKGRISALAIAPDGKSIGTGSWSTEVHVFTTTLPSSKSVPQNLTDQKCLSMLAGVLTQYFAQISQDGATCSTEDLKEGTKVLMESIGRLLIKLMPKDSPMKQKTIRIEEFVKTFLKTFMELIRPDDNLIPAADFEEWLTTLHRDMIEEH